MEEKMILVIQKFQNELMGEQGRRIMAEADAELASNKIETLQNQLDEANRKLEAATVVPQEFEADADDA